MKAEELMIGDFVQVHGVPFEIMAIVPEYAIVMYYHAVAYEDMKPLPLTAEILEDSGFTHDELAEQAIDKWKCKDERPCFMESEDKRISINNVIYDMNTNNDWYVHIDTEDMCTMAMIEITYVHELQHVLKLCNIDKQITL